jgi:crotonobetainyl-CoA:carnitine CoA-transferase CaiB-like acyl-CoA transferase
MFVDVDHPALGWVKFAGNPIKLSRTPVVSAVSPPDLGQHSADVLKQVLGMSDADVADLVSANIVSDGSVA